MNIVNTPKLDAINWRNFCFFFAVLILLIALYPLSVFWRVSKAEQKLFGRSYLIPMSFQERRYTDEPTPASFGTMTYSFQRQGKQVRVYKQLINGFQHTYGSALVSFELGENASDLLFRLNEYLEEYFGKDGKSKYHYLNTKKDLANNAIGRIVGTEARIQGLNGRNARNFLISRILCEIENGRVINHYLDPRVQQLPSLEKYGCPGLPCDGYDKSPSSKCG